MASAGGAPPAAAASTRRAWTGVDQRVQQRMSDEDFRAVADVRRAVWRGGAAGGAAGAAAGFLTYFSYGRLLAPSWLQPKHAVAFTLCGAALGGYAGAATRGMAALDAIGEIWVNYTGGSEYQQKVRAAKSAAHDSERERGR